MNELNHKQRHQELHKAVDELLADFLVHNPGKVPSGMTVMELIEWSHQQTQEPTPNIKAWRDADK